MFHSACSYAAFRNRSPSVVTKASHPYGIAVATCMASRILCLDVRSVPWRSLPGNKAAKTSPMRSLSLSPAHTE